MSEPTASATTARACLSCVEACERRIEAFQASGGSASAAFVRACRDCIDACVLAARLETRRSPFAAEALELCKRAGEARALESAKAGLSEGAESCACTTATGE